MPDEHTWYDRILGAASHEEGKQTIRCPDCNCRKHVVVVLGRVGLADEFGIVCSECGTALGEMRGEKMKPEVQQQIWELGTDDSNE